MTSFSLVYCNACGAANQTQATLCFACGERLMAAVEETVRPFQAVSPVSSALLAGRYRIIRVVSKEDFGVVYKAEDVQHNDSLVAIKSIHLSGLSPQEMIEATDTLNRQARLLSDLTHPHLPRVYEHFTDGENWYLMMDFIEGETLEEYLNHTKDGYLPVEEVLEIGVQLCDVLDYLHTRQPPIIFHNMKPANIMRTPGGQLYLINFGIARHFTPGQAWDTNAPGTPEYAAPEQDSRAQTTVQADIYSLGATLRYLLTGKEPSEPTSGNAAPDVQDQQAPTLLEHFLMQMLELDADKRPESMKVVKRVLLQIQLTSLLNKREALHAGSLQPQGLPARQPHQSLGYATQQTPFAGEAGGQVLQPPSRPGVSRRIVIIGLIGLATIGGSLALSVHSQDPHLLYSYIGHSDRYTGKIRRVLAVAWSPDGKHLASAGDDETVHVWDVATGGNVLTYQGHSSSVEAVAWSPDGKHIASGGFDKTVQVWSATTGGNVLTYQGHSDWVLAVAWSPDGKRLASASDDFTVQVWDAATGGNVLTYQGHSSSVSTVAWSPDGKHIASAGSTVQVWDAATGRNVFTYTGHSDWVNAVAWSPDGKYIASGGDDNTVQVWSATTGANVFTYKDYSGYVLSVAWSPDGKYIASGSYDGPVQVWKAP